jgi:hypothetical protein
LGRLVLENVPVLGKLTVFEAHDIGRNPRPGTTVARKAAVCDHVVTFGEDQQIFVAQRVRKASNKIEQALSTGRNMGAVLDVVV